MPRIYKIITLNIHGIESDTKHRMLEELLKRQEIDIALYQEVTNHKINNIQGYHTYINIGSEKRGTAIAMKEGTHSSDIGRIPTGRGIAAKIEDTWLNIYAPSGTTRKAEREQFFNTEVTYIIPATHERIILAGDVNCTMYPTDCTGTNNHSVALDKLIKGIGLMDAWNPTQTRRGFTHYTATGASRLDRIYATKTIISKKTGIETMAAAFSDHNAVILRLEMDYQANYRGKGYWKMNINMLQGKTFQETFKAKWEKWKMNKKHYPTNVMWWSRYVKKQIKVAFMAEGAERRRDRCRMKNFYYEALNDKLQDDKIYPNTTTKLREIKARIVRIHGVEQ
jgi:exonuclease III